MSSGTAGRLHRLAAAQDLGVDVVAVVADDGVRLGRPVYRSSSSRSGVDLVGDLAVDDLRYGVSTKRTR